MGNYCCIASKHQQKAKHNKYKYKDDHQQQLNDLYDKKLLPITNNNNHNKSSLYNSDKTKLKNLYNNNNNNNLKNDSASILLLSNTSSTVSSVTLSTNTLSEQSTTTTLTNISNNNNNTNYKTRGETHLIPLLKLNQIIIESSSQLDEPIISKELYNINENEDENQEKHSPTANITTTSPLQQHQQVTPLSNKFILNKTVNSKKLSQRKRTSYLNQSLNETDRDLTKTYQYVGRRLLNDDYDEHNNSSSGEILDIKEEAEEHNKPDANNETKTTDALNLFNWKNYKSLQKSKRSIKNLEETIQNSRSIEQWLNDFSKLKLFDGLRKKQQQQQQDGLKQQSLNAINKIDEETITSRSITNKRRLSNCVSITLDDNDDEKESKISQLLPPTLASNNNLITDDLDEFDLILNKERCNNELNLNQFLNEIEKRKQPQSSTRLFSTVNKQLLKLLNEQQHEQEMSFKLTNLLLPKSLANSEDIDMLKWLLTNNQLRLVSFNNELTFTNDHLVLTQQNNMDFLLIANKLNIDLEENDCNNESIITDDDNDDDILVESLVDKLDKLNESYSAYMKYNSLTGCLKLNKNLIEKLLNKEKDLILKLSQTTNAACLLVSSSTSSTTTADLSSSSINPTTDSTNSSTTNTPTIIDKYRKYILDTCNFKGAQILMNIKKKQILNRKCSSTQFNNNINNNNNQMNVNNNNKNKLKSELNKKKIKNNAKNNNKQQQVQYLSPTPLGNFIFFKIFLKKQF
jgi:hypothetical protein